MATNVPSRHPFLSLVCALSLLAAAVPALAQQSTAQLGGRVTDETGAVLPGVTVTATQTDTGFSRTVVTDNDGSYVMPNLPTGPYRLEVMLQGFRTYVQTGIVLQVDANAVINASLQVGELAETVQVEAAAPLVDVRSSGISEVVENERIVELPLQGRNVTDLVVLAGAAVQTGDRESVRRTRVGHLGRRRDLLRRRVPARRRDAQRAEQQPEPSAPVSRRAPGIQRRDERPVGAERHAFGRRGERRHEVGHQHAARQRLRVPARQAVQRQEHASRGSARMASGATTVCSATSSAARSADRWCGTGSSSLAAIRAPSRGELSPTGSPSCRRRR